MDVAQGGMPAVVAEKLRGLVGHFEDDPAQPVLRRIVTSTRKAMGDSSDAVYYDASVSSRYSYRLRGRVHHAQHGLFGIGGLGAGIGGRAAIHELDELGMKCKKKPSVFFNAHTVKGREPPSCDFLLNLNSPKGFLLKYELIFSARVLAYKEAFDLYDCFPGIPQLFRQVISLVERLVNT